MTLEEELQKLREKNPLTQAEAFSFFDALGPVPLGLLAGQWIGRELPAQHPLDGLLSAIRWYGKNIIDEENVHPLLFKKGKDSIFIGNPGMLPLKTFERAPRRLAALLFPLVSPFIRTKETKARLRTIEYRGKITTAMLYDQKPVIDIFARLNDNTILGVTDLKWEHTLGYFFILERVGKKL